MKNKLIKLNLILLVSLFACTSNNVKNSSSSISNSETSENNEITKKENPNIYLAGDSTVKTYQENQFIGGWGQYLDYFLDDNVKVYNCSNGGRSSRSFINEGRLYDNEGASYTFSENNGNSIGDVIEAGDFLLIQFGHNDDDTKLNDYSTLYDRMVPLGTPDENGIYPVNEATKVPTDHLPDLYVENVDSTSKALSEIAKYGSSYYAYDSGGTYKWYLKQYIDFAREKKAIPVLVTPVPRVKFSLDGKEIIGGPGLHGENFAYVQAVRQLAQEEDCLLIDLFKDVKDILETATSKYANYLMALKPNSLTGTWPLDYDKTYNNPSLGCTGIEATHYNKYGAFITAAKVAEAIKSDESIHKNEYFYFRDKVKTSPKEYIDPSNFISKTVVNNIESLFKICNVKNSNRVYKDPLEVVEMINKLQESGEVTNENYLTYQTQCQEIRDAYNSLNVDDQDKVTNIAILEQYEAKVAEFIEANRPKPTSKTIIRFDDLNLSTISETLTYDNFKIVGNDSHTITYKATKATFNYNLEQYDFLGGLSLGGSASFNSYRYVEFTTSSNCTITVAAQSSSNSEDRKLSLVNSSSVTTPVHSFDANSSLSVTSFENAPASTYQIGSTNKGVYLFAIIIEYFD